MILTYIDESGINYLKENSFFKDGPYLLWSGILVPENKYFHTERMFYDLVSQFLGVKDWRKIELHAYNIWNQDGYFKNISKEKIKDYFEELFQLLSKLSLKVVFGVYQKNPRIWGEKSKEVENTKAMCSFLQCLEHVIGRMGETSILISDSPGRSLLKRTRYNDIKSLLYEKTKWRFNPGDKKAGGFKTKYNFESKYCFLLDQLHYVDSKESFFVQLSDHIGYVLNRVLTYSYLCCFPDEKLKADIDKVPITAGTFNFFSRNITVSHYDKKMRDIFILEFDKMEVREGDYLNRDLIYSITPFQRKKSK